MQISLTLEDLQTLLESDPAEFPKYATQIINLANQNAQGTRPRVVGQRDLVLVKTFIGLRFQEAILKKIAEQKEQPYRFSSKEEEARGIDGYIGDLPISIKPDTYRAMAQLPENIEIGFVFYTKRKNGILLEYDF